MVERGTSATTGTPTPKRICPSGAREVLAPPPGRISFWGVGPVVTLVPRFTTEEAAKVLVVAGAFRASRLISPQPSGLGILIFNLSGPDGHCSLGCSPLHIATPYHVIPALMITSFRLWVLGMAELGRRRPPSGANT